MMMLNPVMEIQSFKVMIAKKTQCVHHTVSIVPRASCLIQYEPEGVIDSL